MRYVHKHPPTSNKNTKKNNITGPEIRRSQFSISESKVCVSNLRSNVLISEIPSLAPTMHIIIYPLKMPFQLVFTFIPKTIIIFIEANTRLIDTKEFGFSDKGRSCYKCNTISLFNGIMKFPHPN